MNEEQEMMMNIILSGWLIIALRHAFMKPSVMLLVKLGENRESLALFTDKPTFVVLCIVFDNNND